MYGEHIWTLQKQGYFLGGCAYKYYMKRNNIISRHDPNFTLSIDEYGNFQQVKIPYSIFLNNLQEIGWVYVELINMAPI